VKTKLLNNEQVCALGKLGQSYATMAQISIQRGGGAFNPQAGVQIMNGAMGQSPYWEQVLKTACK